MLQARNRDGDTAFALAALGGLSGGGGAAVDGPSPQARAASPPPRDDANGSAAAAAASAARASRLISLAVSRCSVASTAPASAEPRYPAASSLSSASVALRC